jgi:hypothetical protein
MSTRKKKKREYPIHSEVGGLSRCELEWKALPGTLGGWLSDRLTTILCMHISGKLGQYSSTVLYTSQSDRSTWKNKVTVTVIENTVVLRCIHIYFFSG